MVQELKILGKISTSGFKRNIKEFDVVILDPNVLVDSPECILEITKYTKVIIPVECIQELNTLKNKYQIINMDVYEKINYSLSIIKKLKYLNHDFSIVKLSRYPQIPFLDFNGILSPKVSNVDMYIISYAKYLINKSEHTKVLILSKDKELRWANKYFNCRCIVSDINDFLGNKILVTWKNNRI